jgi:glutathione S-transferase
MIELFEIALLDDTRPSPFCWRTRMALNHKGLPFRAVGIAYSQISALGSGAFRATPVLRHGTEWIEGSLAIATALEARYPGQPSLFPADPLRHFSRFMEAWVDSVLQAQIFRLVAHEVWLKLPPGEQAYFRSTR